MITILSEERGDDLRHHKALSIILCILMISATVVPYLLIVGGNVGGLGESGRSDGDVSLTRGSRASIAEGEWYFRIDMPTERYGPVAASVDPPISRSILPVLDVGCVVQESYGSSV